MDITENMENMENITHHPDDLKHSICDSKHAIYERKHSILPGGGWELKEDLPRSTFADDSDI